VLRQHLCELRMSRREEPFFEVKQLPRPAMVERLQPARLQIHLDPVL
jgi:hypothetical protein